MKIAPKMPMPWDMFIFLTVTAVGFGFSVRSVLNPEKGIPLFARHIASAMPNNNSGGGAPFSQLFDLGCLEHRLGSERLMTSEGMVRIRGRLCNLSRKAMRDFEGLRIKNLSNGFEGTVFFTGLESVFTSDNLFLQSGKNVIQLEWREKRDGAARVVLAEIHQK